MKKTLFFLIGIFILSCNPERSNTTESLEDKTEVKNLKDSTKNFDWLVGNWKRLNNDTEKNTFENWKKETNNRYLGHGFILKGSDTIWQEKMILSLHDSDWELEVKTPGNNDLVKFTLTEHDSNSFLVENPKHDFPKKIKYWKNGAKLNALVTGNENELHFEFERLE